MTDAACVHHGGPGPTGYRRLFVDVVTGENDIYRVNCCTARKTSGVGELRIDKLADALASVAAARQ